MDQDRSTLRTFQIELRYARPGAAFVFQASASRGDTLNDVIINNQLQNILDWTHPHGFATCGRRISRDYLVQPGDKINLCRPLKIDPKIARKQRIKTA